MFIASLPLLTCVCHNY